MIFLVISKLDEESVNNYVPKQRIMSNMGCLGTPEQVHIVLI